MLPPPPYTMLYPYGGLCTLFCVYNGAMEIEELKRKHQQYVALLKSEIKSKTDEVNEFREKYKELRKSALATNEAASIIIHLEKKLQEALGVIYMYQVYYKEHNRTRDGETIDSVSTRIIKEHENYTMHSMSKRHK